MTRKRETRAKKETGASREARDTREARAGGVARSDRNGGPRKIATIGIVSKPSPSDLGDLLRSLAQWIEARGLAVLLDREAARLAGRRPGLPREDLPARCDLVVVIGGDGTMLSVARAACGSGTPILGVNFGSLGFLTEVPREDLFTALEDVLEGRSGLEPRMMLEARVIRKGRTLASMSVLNDVVINKSALARIIDLSVTIDGRYVTTYKSDGLIVATPTGSTGYSLSAGGPIVSPGVEAILLSPICPHTLTQRPLLIAHTSSIEVSLMEAREDVFLTLDGQVGRPVVEGDTIQIAKSANTVLIVRPVNRDPFDLLRRKLKWGER